MDKGSLLAVAAAAMIVIGTGTTALAQFDYDFEGGYVKPCSLDGVNPAYHPEIFGSAAVARSYGFVRARDGTWQLAPSCGANRRPY